MFCHRCLNNFPSAAATVAVVVVVFDVADVVATRGASYSSSSLSSSVVVVVVQLLASTGFRLPDSRGKEIESNFNGKGAFNFERGGSSKARFAEKIRRSRTERRVLCT